MDNLYDRRHREVRAIQNRLYEIRTRLWKESWVELEKPEPHGWYKEWVLDERYEGNEVYQEILKAISVPAWGATKANADKNWDREFYRFPYRTYFGFRSLSEGQLYELSDKAILEFTRVFSSERYSRYRVGCYYCLLPLSYFRVRYRKAYVTHRRVPVPEVEREQAYLKKKLLSNELYGFHANRAGWKDKFILHTTERRARSTTKRLLRYAVKNGSCNEVEESTYWPASGRVAYY